MRAKNLPGFAHARHARRKLAGFCSRMPCAPKTRRVLLTHAMRTEMPLVFPLISRASSQGRMLLRPHEGILLKGKERLMDRVERLILLAADLREEGTVGAQERLSGHQGRPHDANQRHLQRVVERAVTPILSQERSEKHVYLCPRIINYRSKTLSIEREKPCK